MNGGRQLIGYASLNFMLTQILLLTKLTMFWALSVNLLSVKTLMLLLDFIQLLYAPSLNIIIFYGDLQSKTRKNPT